MLRLTVRYVKVSEDASRDQVQVLDQVRAQIPAAERTAMTGGRSGFRGSGKLKSERIRRPVR